MKSLLIGLVFAGAVVVLGGCAGVGYTGGPPSARFPEEKATGETTNNTLRAWYVDSRQIVDDFNSLMLLENPSRLTKWNVR